MPSATGEPVQASYALDGNRALVELAAVVGLSMLPGGRLDPLGSYTYGLGLVIADAIRRGATTMLLGLAAMRPLTAAPGWCRRCESGISTPRPRSASRRRTACRSRSP